jgi:hypothetical protein
MLGATGAERRFGPVRSTRVHRVLSALDPAEPEDDAASRLAHARQAARRPTQ